MTRARWTAPARADLSEIDNSYREIAPDYADRIGRAAFAASRFLAEHPLAGPALGDLAERKWRVARTPYVLIYRVIRTEVQILRVVHGLTDWRRE